MPRKTEKPAGKDKKSAEDVAPAKAARKASAAKSASAAAKATTTAKSAPKSKSISKTAAAKKTAARKAGTPKAAAQKTETKSAARPAKSASGAKKAPSTPRKAKKSTIVVEPAASPLPTGPVEDPIGDVSDGEAHHLLVPESEAEAATAMMDAYREDTSDEAEHGLPEQAQSQEQSTAQEEPKTEPRPHPETQAEAHPDTHLDRLQKILSQAGIASRRHAEEMIVAGRVMVNGQVVTHLGSKADPAHDHIRVDGKLLQGAERHRTFVLNKPRGYVTTVSDPEGRPTVMQFFGQMRERLYPVGRLDFQSEGLLLMTNDGELANSLTRAASGVEKVYLVKVAGQLSANELDRLREGGVSIEKGQQGSPRVRTAPAEVRQIRPGDNPWYEVVLIEGRNREIRKMFSAAGHFVEKIRRVGYGPLALDVEPGRFRELTADEVNALRLTAEGKLKPGRPRASAMLPKEAGVPAEARGKDRGRGREFRAEPRREFRPSRREERPFRGRESREQRETAQPGSFGQRRFGDRSFGSRGEARLFQNREGRTREGRSFDRERPERRDRSERERPRQFDRSEGRFQGRSQGRTEDRFGQRGPKPGPKTGPKPGLRIEPATGQRFGRSPEQRGGFGGRPRFERPPRGPERTNRERTNPERPSSARPNFARPQRGDRREPGREDFRPQQRPPRREFSPREQGAEPSERAPRFGRRPPGRQGGRPDRFRRSQPRFGPRPGGGSGGGLGGNRTGRPPRRDRG